MPITRTPIIDDDGSGTTGTVLDNAWKQELYNQIDGLNAGTVSAGAFTPSDGSGAGLVYPDASGLYCRVGNAVLFQLQVAYPVTANTNIAVVGGLPFIVAGRGGAAAQGLGILRVWYAYLGQYYLAAYHPTTGVILTNADLSGSNNVLSGVYFTS